MGVVNHLLTARGRARAGTLASMLRRPRHWTRFWDLILHCRTGAGTATRGVTGITC